MQRILLFFIALPLLLQLKAQEINFEHIGAGNGLSQISVLSVYQDELGYMWFGTREGLNRYDGQRIKQYLGTETDHTDLPSNVINKITGDNKGRLYLLSGYKYLVKYDKKTDVFETISSNCQTISATENHLWIVENNHIKQLNFSTDKTSDYYRVNEKYQIKSLVESSNSKLYIGTENGLAMLDNNKVFNVIIPDISVSTIYEDSRKNIWIGTIDNGIYKINRNGLTEHIYNETAGNTLSSNIIRDFCEDSFGQIWIATFRGLDRLTPENNQIVNFRHYGIKPTELTHSSIYSLFKDRQGTIWIGTYYGGINYFNPEANIYNYYYPDRSDSKSINFPIVGKMVEDKYENLWICTEGGGLNYFNRKKKTFKSFVAGGVNSISQNNLKSIWYDRVNERLYIGTHLGGISIYDIRANKFSTISTRTNNLMPNDVIEALQPYNDKLVVLTQKGLIQLDLKTGRISHLFSDENINKSLGYQNSTFLIDKSHQLWLASSNGGLKKINLKTGKIQSYNADKTQNGSIGRHYISKIYEDRKGEILFGTIGSGLYSYDSQNDNFVRYSMAGNGLMSDFIYDITETSYGYLTLLTNKGVNLFDRATNKVIIIDSSKGFPLDLINAGCGIYTCIDGEIFVGGTNGMASFYENQIVPVPKDYKLFFSELILDNEAISASEHPAILKQSIPYLDKIRLNYDQNNFVINFATSNYIKVSKTKYEYQLKGLNDKWTPATDQSIKYSNLSPGTYVLHVREANSNNPTGEPKQISMTIHITPPFYASIFAYILYVLALLFVVWKIISFNKSKILLRTSLEYEIRENDRIKELNQTKLQFFTNISHEFRTPLTLIIGQIESIAQMGNLSPALHNKIIKIYNNASQLRNLITELLDFRKQERELLSLKVSNQDIVAFVRNVYLSFNEMAGSRNIDYSFSTKEKSLAVWFDPVQLQKVFYNLISNAFKYSKDGASIRIKVENTSEGVKISVIDTGIGVPEEDLERIFERFYQSKNKEGNITNTFSTGVGLALSKGIVELHHGTIKATRNEEGGTTFSVSLLPGSDHFSAEEKTISKDGDLNRAIESELPDSEFFESLQPLSEDGEEKNATILIVEDNDEMRQFLSEIFSSIYQVETAADGLEAVEKVREVQPDIVLSDIMMPNMSGKELCSKLKSNFETSHIPVVLITADSTEEQNIESLILGADDFITKPFSVKALISRCNNLVTNRKLLQEKFSKQTDNPQVSLATNKMDQELLNKATQVVMKYLDDSEFDVSVFASEMALGRSKLYLKIKGITGMTPNDFIQNIRLKNAANMLKNETELNISDIAYRLGFSTPRYFSKCFKELFGLSPLNYRKIYNPQTEADDSANEDDE